MFDENGDVSTSSADVNGNPVAAQATVTRTDINPAETVPVVISGSTEQLILKGEGAFELRLGIDQYVETTVAADGTTEYTFNNIDGNTVPALELDITGIGAMTLQIGANEGQTIDLRIPELSLLNLGVYKTNVSTQEGADKAVNEVSNAILKYTSAS